LNEMQRRLAEFVDRTTDMDRFCNVLDSSATPVMAVWADGGMGKSSLMARMIHECSLRELRKVEIIYTKGNIPDYLGIMRKCRDDLGANDFAALTDLINFYTVPEYNLTVDVNLGGGTINVANDMQIGDGAKVGNIAAVNINIPLRDEMLSNPRGDMSISPAEQSRKLTDAFLTHLQAVSASSVIVIFIDGVERMQEETKEWFWELLISGISERGLTNVRVVLLGREKPDVDRYKKDLIVFNQLMPLAKADVIEYVRKRGIPEDECEGVAKTLMAAHKGLPLNIATTVDALLEDEDEDAD